MRNRHEARDDIEDAEDFDDLDDAAPPGLPNAARQTPIAPAFSAGFPAHLQLAAPREADYRVADGTGTGTDAAHPVARICDPGRTPSERHDASVTSSNTARSDAIAREDSRHFPTGDDE
ncbi:hypothetical protein [Pandoraea sp. XY-2]|uniref:hypothetical protein n=1 Tax=Pandoraea sp. XY-2 TaxID=2518599 RepID=UPI00101B091E|nr:hypothetical protein [Pandoraea sp. XY-2]QBC30369.1 hypothetical protein DRB87_02030 [Pandoraea sp. XY-2]